MTMRLRAAEPGAGGLGLEPSDPVQHLVMQLKRQIIWLAVKNQSHHKHAALRPVGAKSRIPVERRGKEVLQRLRAKR